MIVQIPSRIVIPAPRSIRHQSPTLGTNYGRQPIRYEMLPQICRELGLRWLVHPLDKPARLVRHHYGTMLIVNALAPEPVRWIAGLEYIGHYLGVPRSQVLEFATVAALGPLASDDIGANCPIWRSDVAGQCIFATTTLMQIIGANPVQADWTQTMAPQEGLEIGAKWMECVRQGRRFRETYRFLRHGKAHKVLGLASPLVVGGDLIGYEGQLQVL